MEKERGLWIAGILIIMLSGFVLAVVIEDYIIGSGQSYNYNEDVTNFYNITVNNTYLNSSANVTQVNITLPGSFSFVSGSNFSDASGTFSNASNVLTWANSTGLIMNLSLKYFAFNATSSTPGNYNITVMAINTTGWGVSSNISVTINDTTAPSITFNTPTPDDGDNKSLNYAAINITATDNIDTIILRFYNSTNYLLNTTSSMGASHYVNITNLSEGVYYYNVTANDSNNNVTNSATRSLRLDITAPAISTSILHTNSTMNITLAISDSGSGIGSSCTKNRGSISGSGATQYLSDDDLDCDTSYTFNGTCTDRAGNSKNYSVTHTTSACSDSSSTSTTTSSSWTTPYYPTDQQVEAGFVALLKTKERMRVKVGTESHYVGIILLTSTRATINVSSTPQQAVFSVGETKSFEVNDDGYYDIKVKLNSVNSTSANVTVWEIYEKMPATTAPSTTTNSSGTENATTAATGSASTAFFSKVTKSTWFWAGLALVIAILAAAGTLYRLKKRKRTKGY